MLSPAVIDVKSPFHFFLDLGRDICVTIKSVKEMEKGTVQPAILMIALVLIIALVGYLLSQNKSEPAQSVQVSESIKPTPIDNNLGSGSAKGVVIIQKPAPSETITSPLTVSGFVFGNNGTLTIKLKQKISGQYVTEDKVVKISGKADKISFAEALQFGLPAEPQTGILEVIFKDNSGKGLDDKAEIEVKFPSDLGKGD